MQARAIFVNIYKKLDKFVTTKVSHKITQLNFFSRIEFERKKLAISVNQELFSFIDGFSVQVQKESGQMEILK